MKKLHIYREPHFFDALFQLFKPLMKQKMVDRVTAIAFLKRVCKELYVGRTCRFSKTKFMEQVSYSLIYTCILFILSLYYFASSCSF